MRLCWLAGAGMLAACAAPSNEQQGLAQGAATMHQLVGRYVDGEVSVFRGMASASDSIPAEPSAQQAFSNQSVMATLDRRAAYAFDFANASGNAAVLRIIAPAAGDYVVLEQTGDATTHVGTVNTSSQSGSQWESCDSCVPDLMSRPATITIASASASGTAGPGGGLLQTTVSAQLALVAPSTLTFDDIQTLGFADPYAGNLLSIGGWTSDGSELVASASGTLSTDSGGGQCATFTPFTVTVYVNAADLRTFGARDYAGGSPSSKCGP